jgi:ketosteroid isomerase-like protein
MRRRSRPRSLAKPEGTPVTEARDREILRGRCRRRTSRRPFEALSVEPEAFFEGDGQIVVFFLQRAIPLGSTGYVERRAAHLWTMRDGKAMALEIFPRREKALEAAGLSK